MYILQQPLHKRTKELSHSINVIHLAEPFSTIVQLYLGCQFYWWREPEVPEKTTNLPQVWREQSWPWLYGSWIYNYLCNQCLSPLTLRVQIRWGQGVQHYVIKLWCDIMLYIFVFFKVFSGSWQLLIYVFPVQMKCKKTGAPKCVSLGVLDHCTDQVLLNNWKKNNHL
jgi:hypothetical protein